MKTIEEAAGEFVKEWNGYHLPKQSCFVEGARFAQRWIPISEELPEYNIRVLFKEMNDDTCLHIGCRSELTNKFVEMGITYQNITHWRPIEIK